MSGAMLNILLSQLGIDKDELQKFTDELKIFFDNNRAMRLQMSEILERLKALEKPTDN